MPGLITITTATPDLFVANGFLSATNSLYHNNGDGTFAKQASLDTGNFTGDVDCFPKCAWGDCDNDGFLDCSYPL